MTQDQHQRAAAEFRRYADAVGGRDEVIGRLGISRSYFYDLANARKRVSPDLALRIQVDSPVPIDPGVLVWGARFGQVKASA